jgi:transposase
VRAVRPSWRDFCAGSPGAADPARRAGHDVEHVQEERPPASSGGDGVRGQGGRARRDPERATSPEGPKRRTFAAGYELRIVREADAALASGVEGGVGELLRREGLYSSHLTTWRRECHEGRLAGLTAKKRGRKPQRGPEADELARLQRENARLQQELAKANTVIEAQVPTRHAEPTRLAPARSSGRARARRLVQRRALPRQPCAAASRRCALRPHRRHRRRAPARPRPGTSAPSERFVRGQPTQKNTPPAAWINRRPWNRSRPRAAACSREAPLSGTSGSA